MSSASAPVGPAPWRERILVLTLAIVVVTALTYPTIPHFGDAGRLDNGDGRASIWNVAWVAHALLTDPRHLLDANIFYPHAGTLAYSEMNLVAGVLAIPFYALTGNPLAATNGAIVLGFLIGFMAMWALVRRLTGSGAAGLVAATAFTFCPYIASKTAEVQLLMTFGFPLVMLGFHRLERTPDARGALALGGALAVLALSCGYYGLYGACAVGLLVLVYARRQPAYWLSLAGAAATALVLVLPVLVPYMRVRASAGAGMRSLSEAVPWSAVWKSYLASGTIAHRWLLHLIGPGFRDPLFPGFGLIVLAAVGGVVVLRGQVVAERRAVVAYALLAGLACWASFGPSAVLYTALAKAVPLMRMLRAPARLGILVSFGLAVIAGFGARALIGRRPAVAMGLLVVVGAELFVPWPIHVAPPLPAAYRLLASLPRGPVVEFPFPYVRSDYHEHTKAMWRSAYNWQPLVNGYSDFTPPDFDRIALPINDFPQTLASFELMRRLGVRYVIFRMRDYGPDAQQRLLTWLAAADPFLDRLTADGDVWLYEIVQWPVPGQLRARQLSGEGGSGTPPRP